MSIIFVKAREAFERDAERKKTQKPPTVPKNKKKT